MCVRKENPLQILGQPEPLEELAHIRGLGRSREDCAPLMTRFGRPLAERCGPRAPPRLRPKGAPIQPVKNRLDRGPDEK